MSSPLSPLSRYIASARRLDATIDRVLANGRLATHRHDHLLQLGRPLHHRTLDEFREALPPGPRHVFTRSLELLETALHTLGAARPAPRSPARLARHPALRHRI